MDCRRAKTKAWKDVFQDLGIRLQNLQFSCKAVSCRGRCNGIAEKSGPATKKRQKSIQETRIPYTTWKVDGATPSLGLSWPLTNRHLLGVVSHLLSLRCNCFLLSNFRWCRCVQENDILVGTCLGWVRKCFKSLLIDPYPYSGSQNE